MVDAVVTSSSSIMHEALTGVASLSFNTSDTRGFSRFLYCLSFLWALLQAWSEIFICQRPASGGSINYKLNYIKL